MISTNQFKTGLTIEIDGDLYAISEFQHVKPGKGGAFVRTKLKNLRTKKMLDKTFRSEEKFEEAYIEEKKMQYLYRAGTTFHFMDHETYEEFSLEQEKVSDISGFLKENMDISIVFYKSEILEVKLPMFIEAKITETEPGIKGDTAKSSFKPATIETGATIQVPLFIDQNDTIKIDTRTGAYVERV
ncbi:MAG: elongation factor P [PVC group bacterium]|nr:elongation factor P [PVC group bacterium]